MAIQVLASSVPEQRNFDGVDFPLVLEPASANIEESRKDAFALKDFVDWASRNREFVEESLLIHGAILFKNFPVSNPVDFNSVIEGFGWEEFPYVGGAAPRSNVAGRVFTANESPPDQKIPFHHEMAQVPENPAKLLFFCDVEPAEQGETPLLLSHLIVKRMEELQPEFVRNLREKGLIYNRVMPQEDDPSSAIGRGWKSCFLTDSKAEADEKAAKLGVHLEWLANGDVKSVTSVLPAFRKDERTGKEAWFNSMVAAYTGWKDSRNVPSAAVTFGDGSPLPEEAVLQAEAIMEESSVAIPWRKGDIVLLDNKLVQHARRTFVPPRRVLASLTK